MKTMWILILLLLIALGCAHAAQVTLDGTWPLYNAVPGTCSMAAPDTCKDLSLGLLYAQTQGRSDSTLVYSANLAGLFGKPFSVSVDQPEGTTIYWVAVRDSSGNRSCRSNIVTRTVIGVPLPASLR